MGAGPRTTQLRLAGLGVVTAALVATASCGTAPAPRPVAGTPTDSATAAAAAPARPACSGFSLSLASDHGGQPSPMAAVEWFTAHGGVGNLPRSGWQEDGPDETGVILRSGAVTVHAIQGVDTTWQVDSGRWC